jgi:hypothetical protein
MKTLYMWIPERAELGPQETTEPDQEPPAPRRRFLVKKPVYRYPVEEGIERQIRALRSRLGPEVGKHPD